MNTTTSPSTIKVEQITPVLLTGLILLASGCSTFPERMTGQFESDRGDFLVVKRDGALYWSPPQEPKSTNDTLIFVGIALPNRNADLVAPIVVPSDSPFQHSSLTFTQDHTQVSVDWGGWPHPVETIRSTEYERAPSDLAPVKSERDRLKE